MKAVQKQFTSPPLGELHPLSAEITRVPPIYLRMLGLLVIGAAFFFFSNPQVPAYRGFAKLTWEKIEHGTAGTPESLRSVPADDAFLAFSYEDDGEIGVARSAPLVIKGAFLELEIAGSLPRKDSKPPHLVILGEGGKEEHDFRFDEVPGLAPERWTAFHASIPRHLVDKTVQIEVRTKRSASGFFFAMRDRVDFYAPPSRFSALGSQSSPLWLFVPLSFALALLFATSIEEVARRNFSMPVLFAVFIVIAALVQLRTTPYFHWDEWHVIERFSKLGFPGVIYTHNEHFLPLFFTFYFVEAKLFGDFYVGFALVSLALHALAGLLLYRFLQRLVPRTKHSREASLGITIMFLVSCLHTETIQWVFEQSVILCELITLAAFLSLLDFLYHRSYRSLALVGAAALAAPLLFGNGFALSLQLGALALCVLLAAPKSATLRYRRLVPLAIACALCAGSAAILYATHRSAVGHGVDVAEQARPLDHVHEIFDYLLVGSQFGAILRGSGLFPLVQLNSAELLPTLGVHVARPDITLGWLGFALSVGALLFAVRRKESRMRNVCLWVLGQALVVTCLLLPSVGRWQLGANQSLALRYHYATLVGVAVLLLVPICQFFEWVMAPEGSALRRRLSTAFFALLLTGQLLSGRFFDYFTAGGYRHRMYVAQLSDWQKQLKAVKPDASPDYEASGTPLQGAQPIQPVTLTPGRHPNEIYAVLHWLNARKYP
ncbi:MAG: hypothetical protein U0136_09330 [Bdellovibrionota bacterium]